MLITRVREKNVNTILSITYQYSDYILIHCTTLQNKNYIKNIHNINFITIKIKLSFNLNMQSVVQCLPEGKQ